LSTFATGRIFAVGGRLQNLQTFAIVNRKAKVVNSLEMSKPPPPPGKRPHWGNPIQLILAICAVLLVLAVAWYAVGRLRERSEVKRLEKQIRQKGDPLTLAELAATYPAIPDDQNAAIPLLEAWEKDDPAFWQAWKRNERPLPERVSKSYDEELPFLGRKASKFQSGQKLTVASREAAQSFLSEREAHLKAIRSAISRPACCFPLHVEDGFDALLPHLSRIKEEAQTLRIKTLLASESGKRDEAIDTIEQILNLSSFLEKEPFLIGQLVEAACLQIAVNGCEDIISRGNLSDAQLNRLAAMLNKINVRPILLTALRNERASDLSIFDPSGKPLARAAEQAGDTETSRDAQSYRVGMKLMSASGILIKDRRLMLEHMTALINASTNDFPQMFARQGELEQELKEKLRGFPPKIFAGLMLPASGKVPQRFIVLEARKRCGLAAIQVERYRLVHKGELPKGLDVFETAFSPDLLKDPFDGKPLRFRATEKGYVVYSVGPDLKDDGGTPPGTRKAKGLDETFRVNFRDTSTNSSTTHP
jgi:hypothetical protein